MKETMQADRTDRQVMKPCRMHDREIKQANRHTGEADRKESHKKETNNREKTGR